MSIDYSINIEKGVSFHVASGTIGADVILKAFQDLYDDADYSHTLHSLWDFRNCTSDLSSEDLRRILHYEQTILSGPGAGKVALVVGSNLDFGLARMYHMLSEQKIDRLFMVFRDYNQALKWIEESDNE